MILEALGDVLAQAVAIMISPIPIAAVIVVLFSARATINGPAFLLGWIAGLAALGAIVVSIADAADVSTDSAAANTSGGLLVAIGVVLILLAVRKWRGRPRAGETPEPPTWMARVEGLGPIGAFVLGVLLTAVNPKNLLLAGSAAITIGQAGLSTIDAVVTWATFVVIASLGVVFVVLYRLVRGEHAKVTLDRAKVWLQRNNAAVLAVIFLVFGAKILGDGLSTLS